MRKLFIKLVLFSLVVFVLAYLLDVLITHSLRRVKLDDFGVWNDIYSGRANSDIIINGSSRAWGGIDTKILEDSLRKRVYNFGMDGQSFYLQHCRYRIYTEHYNYPKIIIQSLDFSTLYKRRDLYNYKQFLPYFNDSLVVNYTKKFTGFNFLEYNLPLVRYAGNLPVLFMAAKAFVSPELNTYNRYKGFAGVDKTWTGEFERVKNSTAEPFRVPLDSLTTRTFEDYLIDCKSRNIKLVFVYPPEYIEGQKFLINRDSIMNLYREYSKTYNIPFLDYSNYCLSNSKTYFYSALHLNKTGAEIFSQKLAGDLKKIL